jgi:hypothetical protein
MLLISILVLALAAISEGLTLALLGRITGGGRGSEAEVSANGVQQIVDRLSLAALGVATAVVFLMWFFPRLPELARRVGPAVFRVVVDAMAGSPSSDAVSIQVVLRSETTRTLVAGTAISLVGYLLRIPRVCSRCAWCA